MHKWLLRGWEMVLLVKPHGYIPPFISNEMLDKMVRAFSEREDSMTPQVQENVEDVVIHPGSVAGFSMHVTRTIVLAENEAPIT